LKIVKIKLKNWILKFRICKRNYRNK